MRRDHHLSVPVLALAVLCLSACADAPEDNGPAPFTPIHPEPISALSAPWHAGSSYYPAARAGAGYNAAGYEHVLTVFPPAGPKTRPSPVSMPAPLPQATGTIPLPQITASELPNLPALAAVRSAPTPAPSAALDPQWIEAMALYCHGVAVTAAEMQVIQAHGGVNNVPTVIEKCTPAVSKPKLVVHHRKRTPTPPATCVVPAAATPDKSPNELPAATPPAPPSLTAPAPAPVPAPAPHATELPAESGPLPITPPQQSVQPKPE